ncbi:MAG: hypothetical protein H6988_04965 [Pseudomonadales bacterium]|nr:hypothetical protein [Halieaceae bacterium]MCP5164587.1 hypothetical protein [Pseudomonadales bacterium]MCP5189729.1 hypothetical protein [Pseudomonadales bacterium]MCP5204274.1 hypothetical protein [Pseudomonadales bacterium]
MKFLLLLVVVAAVAAFLVTRSKKSKPRATLNRARGSASGRRTPRAKPYSATSIACDDTACDAARALGDRQFLDTDRDTPMLPLPGCDAARCNCRYVHREDRREVGEDRRHPAGLQAELYETGVNKNRRRQKRGRRRNDLS